MFGTNISNAISKCSIYNNNYFGGFVSVTSPIVFDRFSLLNRVNCILNYYVVFYSVYVCMCLFAPYLYYMCKHPINWIYWFFLVSYSLPLCLHSAYISIKLIAICSFVEILVFSVFFFTNIQWLWLCALRFSIRILPIPPILYYIFLFFSYILI